MLTEEEGFVVGRMTTLLCTSEGVAREARAAVAAAALT
jgi:hypothetical protein